VIKAKSTKRILSGIVLYFNLLLLSVGASIAAPETQSPTNSLKIEPMILILGIGVLLLLITLIITLVVIIISTKKNNKKSSKNTIPPKSSLANASGRKTVVKAAIKTPSNVSPPKLHIKSNPIVTPQAPNKTIVEQEPIRQAEQYTQAEIQKKPEIRLEEERKPIIETKPVIESFEKPSQTVVEEPFKLPTQSLSDLYTELEKKEEVVDPNKPLPLIDVNKFDDEWDKLFGEQEPTVLPKEPVAPPKEEKNSGLFDSSKLDSDLDSLFTEVSKPKVEMVTKEEKSSGLFDSSKLDSDLDSLFVEVNKPVAPPKEEKSSGLFDSSKLDSDLDSLFIEVSKPVAPPKEEKSSGLFDSSKLDSDLDSLFVEVNKPVAPPKEEKSSGLFDSSKLDSDLDSLFVEVSKPVAPPKEEKSGGLFDSSKLDSDLDSLFVEVNKPVNPPKEEIPSAAFDFENDDLSSLFNAPTPIGKDEPFQTKSNSEFSLDSFDFLVSDDANKPEPVKKDSSLDFGSLDFLVSDEQKQEIKSENMILPSFNLSELESDIERPSLPFTKATKEDIESIDLSTTTMGLNISEFLSSIEANKKEKIEEKDESELKFDMNSTFPPGTPSAFGLPEPQRNFEFENNKLEVELVKETELEKEEAKKIRIPSKLEGFKLENSLPPQSIDVLSLISETVAPPPPPVDSERKKTKGDGIIAIGKMLVDQTALEEIIRKAEKGGKSGLTTTQVITAVKGRSLDTLLVDINNIDGIMGSIIVGKDGLVIANTMPPEIDKDLVGALTSSLFSNIDIQVKKLKRGPLKRLTVETDIGTYILTEIEMGTLVVFSQEDEKINLNQVFKAITSVVGKR